MNTLKEVVDYVEAHSIGIEDNSPPQLSLIECQEHQIDAIPDPTERKNNMKKNNVLIIAHFIFASIFVAFITLLADRSGKYGLTWWYLLPVFTSFVCLVCCASDDKKGGKD